MSDLKPGEKPSQPRVPLAMDGCATCSAKPGETHKSGGCMGIRIGEALCADNIHEADGGCCPERDRELGGAR